ncbi:cytochrome P450 2J5-like [Protopterus annectens]|uniref:cytochrome P450 2J5-like n=1 Tax=Protopterus annectens TaxID=7888 RepID=UPI001CFC3F2E|nr:cytochrome P450 2J5-like [Protopterus annectens]
MDNKDVAQLYRAFPVIRYFPLPSQRIFTIISKLRTFLKEIIEEHRMTMKPDEPRDYIDCYLDAMNKKQNNGLSFDDEGLLAIVIELFLAAVESTAASLDWLLLCMMAYPDIQALSCFSCHPIFSSAISENFTIISKLRTFLKEIIEEHRMTMKPDEPRDYIDCYLDAMNKKQNNGLSFDDEGLLAIVIEFFLASVETTTDSLDWSLLCMMAYPDIQENCSEEIKLVIDEQKEITYNDRHRMPYVRAVIHEIMRFAAIVPLGLPRGIVKDMSFNGYTLPKID